MHFCGIIIKPKTISVVEARKIMGEELVKKDIADWYSTDEYRERLFKGNKKTTSLEEFKKIFEKWLKQIKRIKKDEKYFSNNTWAFIKIDEDGYIDEFIAEDGFYQFYDFPEIRRNLINEFTKGYKLKTMEIIEETNKEEYDVTLIDYHN